MTSDLAAILKILDTYMQGMSDNLSVIATSGGYVNGAGSGRLSYTYSHMMV